LQGAIGLQQIKKLKRFHSARKRNFKKLYEIFKQYQDYFILPETTELADPS